MDRLPIRGPAVRELGLPLPPARMPRMRKGRPLKRWTYVGAYAPGAMLCAGEARVGPLPLRWWALARPGEALAERTRMGGSGRVRASRERVDVRDGAALLALALEPDGEPIEVASPSGRSWIWTRKTPVRVHGAVRLGDAELEVDCHGLVDESAGYHARRTDWLWSAGVGTAAGGQRIAWNVVSGVHDVDGATERTLWVDGEPRELGPVSFEPGLRALHFAEGGNLAFEEWGAREDHTNALLFRSDYRQPFGTFSGDLPGGVRLASGYGVMEEHSAVW